MPGTFRTTSLLGPGFSDEPALPQPKKSMVIPSIKRRRVCRNRKPMGRLLTAFGSKANWNRRSFVGNNFTLEPFLGDYLKHRRDVDLARVEADVKHIPVQVHLDRLDSGKP